MNVDKHQRDKFLHPYWQVGGASSFYIIKFFWRKSFCIFKNDKAPTNDLAKQNCEQNLSGDNDVADWGVCNVFCPPRKWSGCQCKRQGKFFFSIGFNLKNCFFENREIIYQLIFFCKLNWVIGSSISCELES